MAVFDQDPQPQVLYDQTDSAGIEGAYADIMRGLYDKMDSLKRSPDDFRTWTDEDGYLTICDRKKDMVIVSGYNVYPREVNEVLLQHPDVVEAATIGVEDAYRGEVIHSFIATRKDSGVADGEMQKFCEHFLASYKIPIAIHRVGVLPKTSIGKIDHVALRQRLEDVLEAQAGS